MAKGKDVVDGCGHDEIVARLVEYTGGAMRDRVGAAAKGVNHVQVYIQCHETELLP